jgi:hypothetical protein
MFCAVNPPSAPLTRSISWLVPLFFTLTDAPGIGRPSESTTVPDNLEKKLPCANDGDPILNASIRQRHTRNPDFEPLIIAPPATTTNQYRRT